MKPAKPQAAMAVEVLYNHLGSLPHPDHGNLRLVYFGHQSEGQKTITRTVAEAVVMLLASNGFLVSNGFEDAAAVLRRNGYIVASPADVADVPVPEPSTDPTLFGHSDETDGAVLEQVRVLGGPVIEGEVVE